LSDDILQQFYKTFLKTILQYFSQSSHFESQPQCRP